MKFCHFETPVGRLRLAADEEGLREISFPNRDLVPSGPGWTEDRVFFRDPIAQLEEYFAGRRRTFDLDLAPAGTPFQLDVWSQLRGIPYGETVSYGEIAQRLGRLAASRAVGAANGQNPLPIVVPCHRVIGSNGSLTGFGGGLDAKRRLLAFESLHREPDMRPGRVQNELPFLPALEEVR